MREEFIKEEKIFEKTDDERREELLNSIKIVKNNLMSSYNNMEYAEGELIDYYLYTIKANQSKLNYLIKKSKKNGIELSRIEKLQFLNFDENQVV